jgi:hypothetical protein
VLCGSIEANKQQICDLPSWAAPPSEALQTTIIAATGVTDIEWDPMEENSSLALNFEHEQLWMVCKKRPFHFGCKQLSMLPSVLSLYILHTTHKTCNHWDELFAWCEQSDDLAIVQCE